jgi:hypothetical protein
MIARAPSKISGIESDLDVCFHQKKGSIDQRRRSIPSISQNSKALIVADVRRDKPCQVGMDKELNRDWNLRMSLGVGLTKTAWDPGNHPLAPTCVK